MWVLALDSTTRDGSVALVRDDVIVVERAGEPGVSHAERLPADLRAVLAEAGLGLGAVDLFAVASGPGAFTGLRIGLAGVLGLGLALDRPAAGVPTLAAMAWDALAREPEATAAGAWLEASRGEVFAAAYGRPPGDRLDGWPLTDLALPSAATPADTVALWAGVVGAGTPVAIAGPTAFATQAAEAGLRPVPAAPLLAGIIGRVGWRLHAHGAATTPAALMPVYVRRPDVEIERDRRRAAPPA
jgi:tRNA threonylcarbamoyladenosine biosynthesis protein TsaB